MSLNILSGAAPSSFGRDPRSRESCRARRNFLSGEQRTISPTSRRPNLTKFEHSTSIGVAMETVGTEFWKFSRKGWFFSKKRKKITFQRFATSVRHNSAIITDERKLITKWSLYWMSSFHFWATVCKTVRHSLSDRCPVCLSVTLVYCGQTVGQIKMKLGTQVGPGPGHIVLDRDQAPQKVTAPQFSAHVRCGQRLDRLKCHLRWR